MLLIIRFAERTELCPNEKELAKRSMVVEDARTLPFGATFLRGPFSRRSTSSPKRCLRGRGHVGTKPFRMTLPFPWCHGTQKGGVV